MVEGGSFNSLSHITCEGYLLHSWANHLGGLGDERLMSVMPRDFNVSWTLLMHVAFFLLLHTCVKFHMGKKNQVL